MQLSLGFFASGRGSNVEAIVSAIKKRELKAEPKVIICNKPDAQVLELGQRERIPSYCLNTSNTANLEQEIVRVLKKHGVNLIVLAGYIKKIGLEIIEAFPDSILNIHPSLLPEYGGKNMYGMAVHEAVIGSGDDVSGATVHLVNKKYDDGRILSQGIVQVKEGDTAEALAERVLGIEHILYPLTLRYIQEGKICLSEPRKYRLL